MGDIIRSVDSIATAMSEGSEAVNLSAQNSVSLVDKMNEVKNAVDVCSEVSNALEQEIKHFSA